MTTTIINPFIGAAVDPGLALLQDEAVWWLDAATANNPWRGQKIANLGNTGSAIDAARGSITSGPYLAADGTYVQHTATSNTHVSCPDASGLDITGDIDIRVKVSDWSGNGYLIGKTNAVGSYSYALMSDGASGVYLYWSTDGGTGGGLKTASASKTRSQLGLDGATAKWLRATLDIDNGGNYQVIFYTSTDGSSWTTETTVNGTGTTSIYSGSASLFLGSAYGSAAEPNVRIYQASVMNGIAGTTVASFDASLLRPAIDGKLRYTDAHSNPWVLTTTNDNTNVPLYLPHDGTNNYLYLPGTNGNYASIGATGSGPSYIDIRIKVNVSAIPAADQILFANQTTDAGKAYYWKSTGKLAYWNGSNEYIADTAVTVDPSSALWLRFLHASNGNITFYQSSNGTSWTDLSTKSPTGTIDWPSTVYCGARSTGTGSFLGAIYRLVVYHSNNETSLQIDANFATNTNQSSFTESSSNAATVTINRATGSVRKAAQVVRPGWLFATDDWLESADHDDIDSNNASFSFGVLARIFNTPTSYARLFSKRADAQPAAGIEIISVTTTLNHMAIADNGTANTTFPTDVEQTVSAGALTLLTGIIDQSADKLFMAKNGSISTGVNLPGTTDDFSSATGLRIGISADTTLAPFNGEVMAAFIIRRALSSTELGQIAAYYGAS